MRQVYEGLSKSKKRLMLLEKRGEVVFHGSPYNIEVLEPRQAYNRNKQTGKMEKDGKPAVFATPYTEVAIFRSLIDHNSVKGSSSSQFGMNGNEFSFSATKNLFDQTRKNIGRIYILDKKKFHTFEGMQCKSFKKILLLEVIEVTFEDLPKKIEIIK